MGRGGLTSRGFLQDMNLFFSADSLSRVDHAVKKKKKKKGGEISPREQLLHFHERKQSDFLFYQHI